MRAILRHLLAAPIDEGPRELEAWWSRHESRSASFTLPIDRALAGGLAADRLGFAFAAGYDAALHALVPELGVGTRAVLCATERGGGHPRAIEATLRPDEGGGYLLSGHKRWASLATRAEVLLVVASLGESAKGRKELAVARISARAPGVTLRPMPEPPFAPEIQHAELELLDVAVPRGGLLEGDGYERYLKPFRTIEDTHVLGAVLGYLAGAGRRHGWPPALRQETLALVVAIRALAIEAPDAPEMHVALAGALGEIEAHVARTADAWLGSDADERARWERDRPLLAVAAKARALRAERAWSRLEPSAG